MKPKIETNLTRATTFPARLSLLPGNGTAFRTTFHFLSVVVALALLATITTQAQTLEDSAAMETLEDIIPPTITLQPIDRTTTVNEAGTFSVLAEGTEPLSYQWLKNGII